MTAFELKEMDLSKPDDLAEVHYFLRNYPEASAHQYPGYVQSCYPKHKLKFFILFENDNAVSGCLVSARAGIADLRFGPIGRQYDKIAVCIVMVAEKYRSNLYALLKVQLPFFADQSVTEKILTIIHGKINFHIQKKNSWATLILPIHPDYDQIRKGYSDNLRRNIKKALTLGLQVKILASSDEINFLGEIFDALYEWRKVKSTWINSSDTFVKWFNYLNTHQKAVWFGVYDKDGKMLGGMLLIWQGDTVFYQMGASDPHQRGTPILHICFDHAIRWAKDSGYAFFDFGGYDIDATASDQTYHINNFKLMFGGIVQKSHPVLLFPLFKPAYWLVNGILAIRKRGTFLQR